MKRIYCLLLIFIIIFFSNTYGEEWIVFDHWEYGQDPSIWKVHPDGSELTQLTMEGSSVSPCISHNGQSVLFTRNIGNYRDLFIMDINGENLRRLTYFTDNRMLAGGHSSWSLDDSKVVFHAGLRDQSTSYDIYMINSDGSGLERLTNNNYYDVCPTFRPFHNSVVFLREKNGKRKLYEINLTTKEETIFWNPSYNIECPIRFNKDGSKFIVLTRHAPNQILLVDSQTFSVTQLTHGGDIDAPFWSPNEDKIVYGDGENYSARLTIIDLEGNIERLPVSTTGNVVSWGEVTVCNSDTNYSEGFEAGKAYCKTNPSVCGISRGYTEDDLQSAKEEGYKEGKEYCIKDPSACGIVIGYSAEDLKSAKEEGYKEGKQFCIKDPSKCGIDTSCPTYKCDCSEDIAKAKEEGYDDGYADGKDYCKRNPQECGIDIECPPCECEGSSYLESSAEESECIYSASAEKKAKEEGYEEGKRYCKDHPSACGIDTECPPCESEETECGYYDFISSILHLPCVEVGEENYWLDLMLHADEGVVFTLEDYGINFNPEDCEGLSEEECNSHLDVCKLEPIHGIFGVVTGYECKAR